VAIISAYILYIKFVPVTEMVLYSIIGVKRVGTYWIFSILATDLVLGHLFVKKYLVGDVLIVLALKRHMRYDISKMDHSQ